MILFLKKTGRHFALGCTFAIALAAASPTVLVADDDIPALSGRDRVSRAISSEINIAIEEGTKTFLRLSPMGATVLDAPAALAGEDADTKFDDFSPAPLKQARAKLAVYADQLSALGAQSQSRAEATNAQVMARIFRYFAGVPGIDYGFIEPYFGHLPYALPQISGAAIEFPKVMTSQQRVTSAEDAETYLKRLRAFYPSFRSLFNKLNADGELGVRPPKAVINGAIGALKRFITPAPAENPLVVEFRKKLDKIEGLSDEERDELEARATKLVTDEVYPAYRALLAKANIMAVEPSPHDGVWAQPGGEAFYAAALKFQGDTDLSPDDVHQIGLKEVERITGEMAKGLADIGEAPKPGESVGQVMARLGEDPRYHFPDTEEGRAELLELLRTQVEAVIELAPSYFATVPPQPVEVRRIPVFSQDGEAGGFYTQPSFDGTRPGIYWINLRDMTAWPRWALPTLTYHEAVPGHHFQISINQNLSDLPFLRRAAPFNAFVEGWALYAEQLAYEMGLYEADPLGNLGRLQDELFRAVRLVVDTGLHHKRWTREKAINYMYNVTGTALSEVTAEIERYMAWPGQATGYKLGMIKIQSLRAMAARELGDKFDLKAFHDEVLLGGAVPMAVLEDNIKTWIAEQK
ncbi:MAG: DUF885 domain-containing protein [Pseudomonadota bacterium]